MRKNLRFVGLEVHKDLISVAMAENAREPARLLETSPADEWVLDRLGPKSRLRVCYEAGPTGYGLARQLNEQGICCVVISLRSCPPKRIVGSRPIVVTRCGWRTSCVQAIWWKPRFPRPKRKRCGIWSGLGKTRFRWSPWPGNNWTSFSYVTAVGRESLRAASPRSGSVSTHLG